MILSKATSLRSNSLDTKTSNSVGFTLNVESSANVLALLLFVVNQSVNLYYFLCAQKLTRELANLVCHT